MDRKRNHASADLQLFVGVYLLFCIPQNACISSLIVPVQYKAISFLSLKCNFGPAKLKCSLLKLSQTTAADEPEEIPPTVDWDAELRKLQRGEIDPSKAPKGRDGMTDFEAQMLKTKVQAENLLSELPKIELPDLSRKSEFNTKTKGRQVSNDFFNQNFFNQPTTRRRVRKSQSSLSFDVLKEDWRFWAAIIFGISLLSAASTILQREELIVLEQFYKGTDLNA